MRKYFIFGLVFLCHRAIGQSKDCWVIESLFSHHKTKVAVRYDYFKNLPFTLIDTGGYFVGCNEKYIGDRKVLVSHERHIVSTISNCIITVKEASQRKKSFLIYQHASGVLFTYYFKYKRSKWRLINFNEGYI